jgi:hypothetical protein
MGAAPPVEPLDTGSGGECGQSNPLLAVASPASRVTHLSHTPATRVQRGIDPLLPDFGLAARGPCMHATRACRRTAKSIDIEIIRTQQP